ncbi:KamA family radical SAM protein [Microbulbifer sp. ZKSA002]|uniref:KamA family radical SAM protein n=1 Tax=Microbulbifer sp. ZKSA002 TaxID=3243388 RepID=UPI0040391887
MRNIIVRSVTENSDGVWSDWRWQMRNRISTLDGLKRWINVSTSESDAIEQLKGIYRWSVTPYYASLMDPDDPNCPIRLQAVPSLEETIVPDSADVDPVGDQYFRKTNRVVHKYPDRVIFLVTSVCPVYCRHCTRKFHTTTVGPESYFEQGEATSWDEDIAYIESHPQIRDVLLTGGDPLMYSNDRLAKLLEKLRAIDHVEIIRIGSRFPVLAPQRITDELCEMLASFHPVWLNTHFNHPKEVTEEAAAACDRLLRAGIPVGNQTVLLKGVNNSPDVMRQLMLALVKIRVRPYYLYHCDNVVGVSHFMTSLKEGQAIYESLQGHITGFAVPQYVLTTELGKNPVMPYEYVKQGDIEGEWHIRNFRGQTGIYLE